MAMKCNGGGHDNRSAGKFFNTDYNTVLNYINNIYIEMSQCKIKHKIKNLTKNIK